jgi:predicted nucleic acid-binding protein
VRKFLLPSREALKHLPDKEFSIFHLFLSVRFSRFGTVLPDKADWHLFALAHFSEAAYLVSGDGDILSLKPRWGKTKIMKLREFSQEVEKLLIDTKL